MPDGFGIEKVRVCIQEMIFCQVKIQFTQQKTEFSVLEN